ncbi:MAG: response regulator [Rhodocyclales bacterium GT-UBC]|nr:MAG: response regulator [Rhodocyclales bacterium GT-UBC]
MPAAKSNSVLLIDDEPVNIKILSDALKNDYEIIFATSGEEGIRLAQAHQPDLILLDVMMPGMDGYEVCVRLQNDARSATIPVIFVTALGSTAQEVRGLESGALDYITKPINADIVKARVRNHLKYKDVILATSATSATPNAAGDPEANLVAVMTDRQREIFEWVKQGKTNWEISKIIGCSEENVKYHMKNILRILGTQNRTQAAAIQSRPKA